MDEATNTPTVVLDDEDKDEHDHEGDGLSTLKNKNGEKENVAPSSSVVEMDSFSGDHCYSDRVHRLLSEWRKNYNMTQSGEEHANVAPVDGPLTIHEAMQCVDESYAMCEQIMQKENKSLMANGTSELIPMPNNCNPSDCKWVFRAKRDARGHEVRYKARLVAKGFA